MTIGATTSTLPSSAAVVEEGEAATHRPAPIPGTPNLVLLDNIRALGSLLDDLEDARKQNGNRVGALQRRLGGSYPHLDAIQEQVARVEHQAELDLKRFWRKHPLAPWAKTVPGLGEKLVARLIAEIGDPDVRALGHWEKSKDREGRTLREWVIDGYEPRTAAQLRAYCGHGDPARSRKRAGMTQEELFAQGSPRAKMRAYLIGSQFKRTDGSLGRARSPYRDLYEEWRVRYADKTHETPCARCGPAGHPAPPGSPWSKAHQDAAATRNVTKAFLDDLHAAAVAVREGAAA